MTQTIEIASIIVPENRQRREFKQKELEELAESIRSKGLMHPVVLRFEEQEGYHQARAFLVAGERRLRAAQLLGWQLIPFTPLKDLSDYEYREAEYEENVRRVDLTWQEKADALAGLHALRLERNPKQTFMDTAREVDDTASRENPTAAMDVAAAALIAPFRDDPEVKAAKNLRDAKRIVERKIRGEFAAKLHEIEKSKGLEQESRHTLLHNDCRDVLGSVYFEPGTFSCIIADPPYGAGADEFGDAARTTHRYEDTPELAMDIADAILSDGYRLTRDQAHVYIFCDIDLFHYLRKKAESCGWRPFRRPLIWYKGGAGHIPWGSSYWRVNYELIFFAEKGNKPLSALGSCLMKDYLPQQERDHAAEKPVSLYKYLLGLSCLPGDAVLDPCCGSGTVFAAADSLGLRATGIEADEETHRMALSRLRGLRG